MAKRKIHFTDKYGQGTIEAKTDEQYEAIMSALADDPEVEDIWTETWDPEEGWQA